MGLWDFFKGFGESLGDWGGAQGMYGLGSINPAAGESFKGLDFGSFPGREGRDVNSFTPWYRTLDYSSPKQNESEQLYQMYLRAGQDRANQYQQPRGIPGVPDPDYLYALASSAVDRQSNPSIPLRNAQHGFVGQVAAQSNPLGALAGLFTVPTYNFAKLLGQNTLRASGIPYGLDMIGDALLDSGPNSITEASPPSWEAIKWGLRPFWGRN